MSNAGVPAGRTVMELHEHEVPRMVENKASDEKFICKQMGSNAFSMVNANLNHRSFMEGDAAVQAVTDERVLASSADFSTYGLNIQARQACVRTSFDAIQGQLAKISSMLSRFAVSHGKQSTSPHASKPEQSKNISVLPAAPAHVASQVFAEMPTPSSSQRTQGTVPNYCSGHHKPIQSSCVSDLSEQNLEMPQSYGFNNLDRQSVCLADGTEHSYFTLPTDYHLERAVPEIVFDASDVKTEYCSNAFVDVSAKTPEQQPYEEDQQEDVRDFTLELQQDDEKACHCPVRKASDSVVTSSNQLSIEHNMRELRLLWDPGATNLHVLFTTVDGATQLQCTVHLCLQVGDDTDTSSAL